MTFLPLVPRLLYPLSEEPLTQACIERVPEIVYTLGFI